MKKLFLVALFLFICNINYGQEKTQTDLINPDVLIEDYNYLLKNLEASHPNLYAHIPKEEFIAKTSKLKESINRPLSMTEFNKILLKTIGYVQQGHTMLFGNLGFGDYLQNGGLSFPFKVKYFEGNMYVDKNLSSNPVIAKGAELIAINKIPVSQIIETFTQYLRIRPNGFKNNQLEFYWPRYLWLEYGFGGEFVVSYILPGEDTIRTATVAGISTDPAYHEDEKPENFKLHIDDKHDIAIMTLNTFFSPFDEFNSFITNSFEAIQKSSVNNLIVDIRKNGGGNSSFLVPLIDYITDKPGSINSHLEVKSSEVTRHCYTTHPIFMASVEEARKAEDDSDGFAELLECLIEKEPGTITKMGGGEKAVPTPNKMNRFKGNLFVVTSNRTFSAATDFAAVVKDNQLGYIVGEETSDTPSSYGCIMLFELPNTKANIQNSTVYKIRSGGFDNGRGVIPDYPVNTTYADFLKGTDKTLNYIYWLVAEGIAKRP